MDENIRRAMEDVLFIKKAMAGSQVQLSRLSAIFFIVAVYETVVNAGKFISFFTVSSIQQQGIVSLIFSIVNMVFLCILAVIFFIQRNKFSKTSGKMAVRFFNLWGIVLFFPAVFNVIKIIAFVVDGIFKTTSAFSDHYFAANTLQTLQIAILCIALIATGIILNNRLIIGWGVAVLVAYVLTFIFPNMITVPGNFSDISITSRSVYMVIISPLTYFMMGFYLKKKAGDTDGNS